jgi:O-acetylserine/cysteine efflux transporter
MSVDLISPITAALLRQLMVLVICAASLRIIPGKMRQLLGLGALSGALFYLITNLSMSVSDNVPALAIAGQMGAPFALIGAVLIFKEKIHLPRIIGTTLAFLGIGLIVFDPAALHERLGLILSLAASAIWAICSLIQRRLQGVPVLTIYAWVGLMGSLLLLPCAFLVEPDGMKALPHLPWSAYGWVLFSALGSTVIGQGSMSYLLQRHPINIVIPLTLANPVIAVVTSAWWFGTAITPLMIIGGLIVFVGIAIVSIRTARAQELEDG